MKKIFNNKRYEEILKEFENEERWGENLSGEENFDDDIFGDMEGFGELAEAIAAEDRETEFFDMDVDDEIEVEVPEEIEKYPIDIDDEDEDEDEDWDYKELLDKILAFVNEKKIHFAVGFACLFLIGIFGLVAALTARGNEKQVASNYQLIGTGLMDVDVLGGDGLLALRDVLAKKQPAHNNTTTSSEYYEINTKADIQVKLVMTSVMQDLKIKFTNKDTGKLIANIPFQVQVKSPEGLISVWTDEDMDGIVYMKNIDSGKYTVTLKPLEDDKYDRYLMIARPEDVTVKENITYEKVDISAEIKDESEINVSKEEQNVVQTPVEEEIKDTVAWVESTKTYIGDQYREINKADIQAPTASLSSLSFVRTEQLNPITEPGNEEPLEPTPSEEPTPEATEEPTPEPTPESTPEPTEEPTPEPTPTPTPTPTATPSPTPTATPSPTPTATPSPTPSPTPTATPTPTVTPSPTPSATPSPSPTPIALKTKDGKEVYVKDGDKYKAAVSSDYNQKNMKFYVKEQGYKYTGWNTIDGDLYYFDANGKAVTGDQIIRGIFYEFDEDGKVMKGKNAFGIDVSSHNGSIDWSAVAKSGVEFVIIRCGYRGYGSGVLVEDSRFRTNIKGATNAGLKVGVYFFTQAIDEIEAVEEASMVLNAISGYKITFPIFLDVEYSNTSKNGRADGLGVNKRTDVCNAFCKTITNAGYRAGVYANKTWLNNYLDTDDFAGSTKIWLAQYAKEPSYGGHYDMWQYSCTGSISGIKGNVDLNMSYLGY